MIEVLVGNCTDSETPDDWYPELGAGQISEKRLSDFKDKVQRVIDLCNSCPVKDACLQQGMTRDNLPYGIWGGKLAGQRLHMAGFTKEDFASTDSEVGRAFKLIELLGVQ